MIGEAFDQLVLRFFDNELSGSEFSVLQATLAESAESRRRYLQLAELNGLLAAVAAQSMPQPIPRRVEPPLRKTLASRKAPVRLAPVLAAAAAMAVAALVAHGYWKRSQPLVTFRTAPGSLWETTHAGVAPAAGKPGANTLGIGSRLMLRQGVVELDFASGVKAYVNGPADLTLDSKDLLRMNEGRGRFTVPPKAHGFKVVADGLEVVDLGTEFGVLAQPDGRGAEVHVFRGSVSSAPSGGRGEVLREGLARRIEAGESTLREIPVAPTLFSASLPQSLPYLHWSFDEVSGSETQAEGEHPAVAGMETRLIQSDGRSAAARLVHGVRGRALSFDGKGDYMAGNWPGIDGNRPRTIVMWVRYPNGALPLYDGGGVAWGTRMTPGDSVCWSLIFMASAPTSEQNLASPPLAVPYVSFGRWWRYGSTNVADGKWHCIAMTYTGAVGSDGLPDVALYADGNPEKCQSVDDRRSGRDQPIHVDTRTDHPHAAPLEVGRSQERIGDIDHVQVPHRYFNGEIDDLYIIEGVLSPTEIRDLSDTGRFGSKQ